MDEPDADRKLSAFFEIPVRHCFTNGEVFGSSSNLEGIAAWVPGEKAGMTLWRLLLSGTILFWGSF